MGMADRIDAITPKITLIATTPQAQVAAAVEAANLPTDAVVITTPSQLKTSAAIAKAEAKRELAEADLEERKAVDAARQAEEAAAEAARKQREALDQEKQAELAQKDADKAAEKQAQAEQEAAQNKALLEARQAEAFQAEQEIALQRSQAQTLLDSGEQDKFNQGLFLLNLADAGARQADSARDEAVVLSSNVQASLDVAESSKAEVSQKLARKAELQGSASANQQAAKDDVELSGRAKEAADALKLSASERRKVAEKLLAESDTQSELSELGQHVEGGFLVSER